MQSAESVDLSLYLPLATETVETQSEKYGGACPMRMQCMNRQSS